MGERPTLAFRVDKEQKDRWKTYADENDEYDTLSHLVRVSVAREMSDEYGPIRQQGGSSDGGGVGELLTAIQRMQARIESLEETVQDTSEAVYTSNDLAAGTPSESAILRSLPEGEDNAIPETELLGELNVLDGDMRLIRSTQTRLYSMEVGTGAIRCIEKDTPENELSRFENDTATTYWYRRA